MVLFLLLTLAACICLCFLSVQSFLYSLWKKGSQPYTRFSGFRNHLCGPNDVLACTALI